MTKKELAAMTPVERRHFVAYDSCEHEDYGPCGAAGHAG